MMWIAMLIALVLSVGALAFVVWPLLKPGPAPVMVEDDRLTELLGRKDAVLQAIKDLEFDYQVGKLSEEDFQLYDQRLRRQAVALLQQIEEVAPQSADIDAAMEAEIAQRRRVLDPARGGKACGCRGGFSHRTGGRYRTGNCAGAGGCSSCAGWERHCEWRRTALLHQLRQPLGGSS